MCVVAMLRATHKTPEMTEPFASQGWIVAAELVAAPPDADLADFSIAEGVRPEDAAELVEQEVLMAEVTGKKLSVETMLTIAFPRVGSGELRKGKSGDSAPSFTKEDEAAPGCACGHATR